MDQKMDLSAKELRTDYISIDILNRMSLTLNSNLTFEKGAIVPKLWHWLFFLPFVKASKIGKDGHPKKGEHIPDIEGQGLRMWAGSRFWFHKELYASRYAKKESKVSNVLEKNGRSGKLVFVLVRHEYYQDGSHILSEEQNIVYKQTQQTDITVADVNSTLSRPHKKAQWSETIEPNPVMLFNFSALTFNAHRIHYDRDFCKNDFGFPGLVLHGPLIAILLIDLIRKNIPMAKVVEYSFRVNGPIFDFQKFKIEGCHQGDIVFLWAINDSGLETLTAEATIILS